MAPGRVAVVLGGSKGIGQAVAAALGATGRSVVVTYHTDRSGALETLAQIERHGGTGIARQADAGDPESLRELFDQAMKLGRIDAVVHGPVTALSGGALEIAPADWQQAMAVSAFSFLWSAQAVSDHMAAHGGGSLVALTSAGSTRVVPGYAAVGVPKAALEALVKYLAVELAPRGVR
ncbi:MAG TPA: SDR family oxidoreductase, partial [Symbiobacteriaceae bacterium]|nr:SDR family oxidoreductase [Symbiobacteriaceae bacterium]